MGIDIHTYLCKYDPEDNLWHELKLYRKDKEKIKEVSIFDRRNSDLFGILQNEGFETDMGTFPSTKIAYSSLEEEFKERVVKDQEYCYGFNEVSLSDMKCYIKEHPIILEPHRENPVKEFFEECVTYISFADEWFDFTPLSRYKLLYWFDH